MKPASKHLLSRTALALLTLLSGAPVSTLCAMGDLSERPGRPMQLGNDGVGGIEKTGGTGGTGPVGKANPGGAGPSGPVAPAASSAALPSAWIDLGEALGSEAAQPKLAGSGTGEPGTLVTLSLTGAKPGAVAALVIGISTLNVPFKGGTLVPAPMLILPGLPVNGAGALDLPAMLPASLPSGLALYTQMWMPDASAKQGFTASNGLELLVP